MGWKRTSVQDHRQDMFQMATIVRFLFSMERHFHVSYYTCLSIHPNKKKEKNQGKNASRDRTRCERNPQRNASIGMMRILFVNRTLT